MPNELNRNVKTQAAYIETDGGMAIDSSGSLKTQSIGEENPNPEQKNGEVIPEPMTSDDSSVKERKSFAETGDDMKISYAISEETAAYIDELGIQTIEKRYIVPYYSDIREIAPALITTNDVQYAVESIVQPQIFEEKTLIKEQVAVSEEEAKNFLSEIEYDGADGIGILNLDTDSIKVELNKNEKIPSETSIVKTYDMEIKDQDKIPQTLKINDVTYHQGNVKWSNMGDPGSGINGTEKNDAYGTYQTIATSWRATVTYTGTKYTEEKDYKATAVYVGDILVKNPPKHEYIVIYKPNSKVSNISGVYYNNYVSSAYGKENEKIAAIFDVDTAGLYHIDNRVNQVLTALAIIPWLLVYFTAVSAAYIAYKTWKRANKDAEKHGDFVEEKAFSTDVTIDESDDSGDLF